MSCIIRMAPYALALYSLHTLMRKAPLGEYKHFNIIFNSKHTMLFLWKSILPNLIFCFISCFTAYYLFIAILRVKIACVTSPLFRFARTWQRSSARSCLTPSVKWGCRQHRTRHLIWSQRTLLWGNAMRLRRKSSTRRWCPSVKTSQNKIVSPIGRLMVMETK